MFVLRGRLRWMPSLIVYIHRHRCALSSFAWKGCILCYLDICKIGVGFCCFLSQYERFS